MTATKPGLDPTSILALGVHAHPGTYALMIGSGVSTGAGLPTGWGVVKELVSRLAAQESPEELEAARTDPQGWWDARNGGPLTYSAALEALASTPAARHSILDSIFKPTDEELEAGSKRPTAAHHAIAELVRSKAVRVIVTTNFDHLLENALEAVGISPQVISRTDQIAAMTPLVHATATIVMVNGDYSELDKRNTAEELAEYPPRWRRLLDQIFEEFGLLVSGWSAEYDTAVVARLERATARRYPLYWDSRSSNKSQVAKRLLAARQGTVIPSNTADELFPALVERLRSLRDLSQAPLETAAAVAALKRWLPDSTRRVQLEDLVRDAAIECAEQTAGIAWLPDASTPEGARDGLLDSHVAHATPAVSLLTAGVFYDRSHEHADLWVESFTALLGARTFYLGSFEPDATDSRHYPAAVALRCMGVIAVRRANEALLLRLLRVQFTDEERSEFHAGAMYWLHDERVLPFPAGILPRWKGQVLRSPLSALLREHTADFLRPYFSSDADLIEAQDDYEYRLGLIQFLNPLETQNVGFATGMYMGEHWWSVPTEKKFPVERRFLERYTASPRTWPLVDDLNDGGEDRLEYYAEEIRKATRPRGRF